MEKTKVSIITVVYNGAETIEETIQSVMHQTYDNIEYILIDGASTDGTCDIIREYQDSIATFISEPDAGLYFAMNKGIQLATGEIIGILNADDLYTPDAIMEVVKCFENSEADIVYGNAQWFDELGKYDLYACENIETLWYQMTIPHPATFVKKKVYRTMGNFDTQYFIAADYDFILRCYSSRVRFAHLDRVVTYFRRGGMSTKRESVCMEEARRISLQYVCQSGEETKYFRMIERDYHFRKFRLFYFERLQEIQDRVQETLRAYAKGGNIAIFGIGEWGVRCHQMLQDAGCTVGFFIDNNPLRWGRTVSSIGVKEPNALIGYDGCVFVATYKYEDEIVEQLRTLDSSLTVYTIADLAENVVKELK